MAIVSGPRSAARGCAEMTCHLSNFVRDTADFSPRISQISIGIRVIDRIPIIVSVDRLLSDPIVLVAAGFVNYETNSTSIR